MWPHTCTLAHISLQQNTVQTASEDCFKLSAERRCQIAVEDELVPDRDKKIIKSPKNPVWLGHPLLKLKERPASAGTEYDG